MMAYIVGSGCNVGWFVWQQHISFLLGCGCDSSSLPSCILNFSRSRHESKRMLIGVRKDRIQLVSHAACSVQRTLARTNSAAFWLAPVVSYRRCSMILSRHSMQASSLHHRKVLRCFCHSPAFAGIPHVELSASWSPRRFSMGCGALQAPLLQNCSAFFSWVQVPNNHLRFELTCFPTLNPKP